MKSRNTIATRVRLQGTLEFRTAFGPQGTHGAWDGPNRYW